MLRTQTEMPPTEVSVYVPDVDSIRNTDSVERRALPPNFVHVAYENIRVIIHDGYPKFD